MSEPAHILVVDDHDEIRNSVSSYLERNGMRTSVAESAAEMDAQRARHSFDLIVLDVMMPGLDGLSTLEQLKQRDPNMPVIMITKSEEEQIMNDAIGKRIDDYLTKPFITEELLARLRALLRRAAGHSAATLEAGKLVVDTRAARASVNGEPVKLTAHEYRVLSYLMHHMGRVVPRTELVEHIYDQDFDRDSNTIEVFIGRLRRKIGQDRIQTERGLGYRLVVPDAETRVVG